MHSSSGAFIASPTRSTKSLNVTRPNITLIESRLGSLASRLGLRGLSPFVKPLLAQRGTKGLKVLDDRRHTQSPAVAGSGTIHTDSLFNILMILPADADAA
jgi:hypothetical protein